MDETKFELESGSIVRTVGLDFVDTFLDLIHSIGSLITSLVLVALLPIRAISTIRVASRQRRAMKEVNLALSSSPSLQDRARQPLETSTAGPAALSPEQLRKRVREKFEPLEARERRLSVNLIDPVRSPNSGTIPVYAENGSQNEEDQEDGGDQRQPG